jgi:hypothetical protein
MADPPMMLDEAPVRLPPLKPSREDEEAQGGGRIALPLADTLAA